MLAHQGSNLDETLDDKRDLMIQLGRKKDKSARHCQSLEQMVH